MQSIVNPNKQAVIQSAAKTAQELHLLESIGADILKRSPMPAYNLMLRTLEQM